MKSKIILSLIVVLLCLSASVAFAKQPALANYSTITTHDCSNYECEKSLYKHNKLEITRNNISLAQSGSIEKHINAIQTLSSSFPGFNSTVLWKIPNNMTDKALHCHKAKPQKLIWIDSSQQSITLKYRHECWQFNRRDNKINSRKHKFVEQVKDVVYTIKITREATSCLSSFDSVHPNKFECIPIVKPEKLVMRDKHYTLVPLDEVALNPFISIKFDDDIVEFVLVDISDELDATIESPGATVTQASPEDTNTEPPVADPLPESDDDDSEELEDSNEDSGHEEDEAELEHDNEDSDHEENETELEHENEDFDHEEDDHSNHEHSDDN